VRALTPIERHDRRRRRRREELIRWAIRVAVALVLFGLGIAVGQAMQDNPSPGETVTLERTLSIPTAGNPGATVTP
jgi:hypothetical protein